jgi:ribonuclease E
MAKRMLIDAAHPEETRVVVLSGNRLEEFDFESSTKKQVKGNIYLAKVTRVEPSLQAAFVDYGGNRHGFLAFSEIHPDYYRIPVSDRSGRDGEPAKASGRGAANGGDDSGVPLSAALPEPVPVPEVAAGEEDAPAEEERGPEPQSDSQHAESHDGQYAESHDGDQAEHHVGETASDPEPRHELAVPITDAAPATDWNAPPPPAEAAPDHAPDQVADHAEGSEHYQEPEPTLAAWQEDWRPPPTGQENASDHSTQTTDLWDEAHADGVGGQGSEPGSIALRAAEESVVSAEIGDAPINGDAAEPVTGTVETLGGDEVEEVEEADAERRRRYSVRHYKIQEVIKRRQIMLVQVAKEERGNKGAALTTYLSLAGRYCVLMPNTGRGGGVSRKITSVSDRRRLKEILEELEIPEGMGVIVRTAGSERSKAEIKRDYEYLLRLWNEIRDLTLKSTAPALIYEEGNLIKRAIRDLYSRDIDEVQVEGEEGYKTAKAFMRTLMPSHAKRVQPYRDPQVGLFHRFQVESQIDAVHSPVAQLRSGGYIVINQTEALVAIDVNSGRSTRERNIEETALRTNLEAADEIGRQLRLRDLAGLIVIDFIDMEEHRNQVAVERRLKEALKNDRARIQVGRISPFGLLEMSRQRLRPSLTEASTQPCPHCGGTGFIRSVESTALYVLRSIEEEGIRRRSAEICIYVPTTVALYMLNQKRESLAQIEGRYGIKVLVARDDALIPPSFRLERLRAYGAGEAPALPRSIQAPAIEDEDEEADEAEEAEIEAAPPRPNGADAAGEHETDEERGRRRRRRRRRRSDEGREGRPASASAREPKEPAEPAEAREPRGAGEEERDSDERRRRRRGRRGGRIRGRRDEAAETRGPHVAAETIEIVPSGDGERVPEEIPAESLHPWAGDAGVETASLAPLAGESFEPRHAPLPGHEHEPESPAAPTAEAEEGVPFVGETERVLEQAAAASQPAAPSHHETTPYQHEAPSYDEQPSHHEPPSHHEAPSHDEQPSHSTPATPNEEVLTVDEKPANPRRGWWQRLTQS